MWSGGPESGEPPMIREVEWRTGREIARLSFQGVLDPLSGGPIEWVAGASWEKNRVVVATSADLAIISAKDNALVLEEVVAFDYPGLGPASVFAPLLHATGSRVSFVVDEVTSTNGLVRCAVVTYDLGSNECRRWISRGAHGRRACVQSQPAALGGRAVPSAALKRRVLYIVFALCVAGFVAGVLPARAEAAYIGWFDYARNNSNINGTLTWKYTVNDNPPVYAVSWRAGSGSYPNDRKQTASQSGGWLPSGWYSIRGHWNNYNGSAIFGRVWYLSDKVNSFGEMRTSLFIHTEETPSNGQYNPTSGDDPQCWEGVNDYYSHGCMQE